MQFYLNKPQSALHYFYFVQLLDNINGGVSDVDQEASELNVKLPLELANIQISEKDREIEELCEKLKNLEEQSKKVHYIIIDGIDSRHM